jgi:membrane protein required for colicin V production
MVDNLLSFYKSISSFDLIYLIITIWSLIRCSSKGFVLSVLSASKWLLAYVITLILFPKIKPHVKDVIDNQYILDLALGIGLFIVVIFVILIINKSISKTVKYSGIGKIDTIFGFFFAFVRAYIVCVCIFATVNIFYNYKNWPLNISKSFTFSYVQKGSNYLVKEFPNEKEYKDAKEKVQEL